MEKRAKTDLNVNKLWSKKAEVIRPFPSYVPVLFFSVSFFLRTRLFHHVLLLTSGLFFDLRKLSRKLDIFAVDTGGKKRIRKVFTHEKGAAD